MYLTNLSFTCRHMQQQTRHKKGNEPPAYFDPQMMTRIQILIGRDCIVKYLIHAMCHHNSKEMLVIPFNTSNHWLLLSISTTYDQVWYRDSARSTDPDTDE
jgi:hypothetical protein